MGLLNLRRLARENGQSFIEYLIICGVIIVVIIAFAPTVAQKTRGVMQAFLSKV